MLVNILQLLGGLIVLIIGGEGLVRGSSNIALRMRITPLVVGLTIVAFGTSAPELFISLFAALSGSPDMAMGNVVGSNFCNIALVMGITAIIFPILVNKDTLRLDYPVAIGSSFLLYLLTFDGMLQRWEGAMFFTLLIGYIFYLFKKSKNDKEALKQASEEYTLDEEDVNKNTFLIWAKDISFIVVGIVALTFGSDWFVGGAESIFIDLGVSERVIGITVLALGTSLPEMVTSIVAAMKKETDLAVGNLMGSNIFNVLSILGITSMVTPIPINEQIHNVDMLWMLGIMVILLPIMVTGRKIDRFEGALMVGAYFFYIASLL